MGDTYGGEAAEVDGQMTSELWFYMGRNGGGGNVPLQSPILHQVVVARALWRSGAALIPPGLGKGAMNSNPFGEAAGSWKELNDWEPKPGAETPSP